MQDNQLKILLYNPCYFRNIGGSLKDNLRYSYRHVYTSEAVQKKSMDDFLKLVGVLSPDIIALVEVEIGSSTNKYLNQLEYLATNLNMYAQGANKYNSSHPLAYRPMYVGKSNGYLSKERYEVKRHFLKVGFKSLVYIIKAGDINLFILHLATSSKKVRSKQLKEIKKLTDKYDKVVICGDFNIYTGIEELAPLTQDNKIRLINDPSIKTFPSVNPKFTLDLFLASKTIADYCLVKVVDDFASSDHFPVILEYKKSA